MKLFLNNIKQGLICVAISLFLLSFIFCFATIAWICITTYSFTDFSVILSLILKNAGSYSALLVGIVVTIFFQIYLKEKDAVEMKNEKIKEIGYYTLAFSSPNEQRPPDSCVTIIFDERDYSLNEKDRGTNKESSEVNKKDSEANKEDSEANEDFGTDDKELQAFNVQFFVSGEKSVTLKNIMAFSDDYFEQNRKAIQNDYFKYCEKIEYMSPQFCIATPVKSTRSTSTNIEPFKHVNLVITQFEKWSEYNAGVGFFWISAITEEGFLMFIKIKVKMDLKEKHICTKIYQQTTYYKDGKKLKEVCRY